MENSENSSDESKLDAGTTAAVVWLIVGVVLFLTSDDASLVSLFAILYLILGMFGAAYMIGIPFYLIHKSIWRNFADRTEELDPQKGLSGRLKLIETFVTVLVTWTVFKVIT